ncbi:Fur-regulated basic protein B [Cytobacillus firmus]|uniref:Fur-regulated basic protein B n=2 Tax=Cytobacillus TaxID=2675230 RepID=A0A366JGZ5_CYTFI|nr:MULTISPECIES: FbpB family small basic protein [Cytobacillus]RBP86242.1 Fur-regulated basic protein B [Cytobacillus firmus]TDX35893.1 Fur-regulated basic protein B [Cytobacillus oceanisediminis]
MRPSKLSMAALIKKNKKEILNNNELMKKIEEKIDQKHQLEIKKNVK